MWELHSHSATAEFQDEKEDYERKSHAAQNFYVTSHAPKTVPPNTSITKTAESTCVKSLNMSTLTIWLPWCWNSNTRRLPEFWILLVKENCCWSLSRGKEVRSGHFEAFKERRGDEMRSVGFCGRQWTNLELWLQREIENMVWERIEILVKIFGDAMVCNVEETPFFAGLWERGKGSFVQRLRDVKDRKFYRSLRFGGH